MAIVRESEAVSRAAAELNAHVASLDQGSDSAHIINEIFYHMNQISEETEKVILLNNLLNAKNSPRVNLLGVECKQLLLNFYQALLNKVHQDILDGLIKEEHNGILPPDSELSNDRIKKETHLHNKIVNRDINDKLSLTVEKKIIILEALKQKQISFQQELRLHGNNQAELDHVTTALQHLNQRLEDCYFLYESQRKRMGKSQALLTTNGGIDKTTKTNMLASDRETSFFQHINTLHSTIGETHPRTQCLIAIKENMLTTKNPVLRTLILGDVLDDEINTGKFLLKPDLVIMKQYRDALLKLASIQLMDDLIGEEKLSKLQEPWLSIERNQVLDRILNHCEDDQVDPCADIKFPSALTPLQHEQMKLVLLQGIKLMYQTSNNHEDIPHNNFNLENSGDVARLIKCLEMWETKYKNKIKADKFKPKESETIDVKFTAPGVVEEELVKPAKRRWKILNIFNKRK